MEWKAVITSDEVDHPVFEWWNGSRKITMYPMEAVLITSWGIDMNSEMEVLSMRKADAVIAAFKWLEEGAPDASARI